MTTTLFSNLSPLQAECKKYNSLMIRDGYFVPLPIGFSRLGHGEASFLPRLQANANLIEVNVLKVAH
jgi:hypothetical protein